MFNKLKIISLNNALIQRKTHEGRNYIVAPVVLITEGVHVGSSGKVFHSSEELQKNFQTWNGIPLPVMHPKDNDDNPISANDPDVVEQYNVGRLYNVKYEIDPPRLVGELWIDTELATQKSPKMIAELNAGRLEVSTGMWHESIPQSGEWNGEEYDYIAKDYRPDHLALLPGWKGACSWEDGCGAPRLNCNNEQLNELKKHKIALNELSHREIANKLQMELDKLDSTNLFYIIEEIYDKDFIYGVFDVSNEETSVKYYRIGYNLDREDNVVLSEQSTKQEVAVKTEWININEISDDDKRERLWQLLRAAENSGNGYALGGGGVHAWLRDVFEKYIIYEWSNDDTGEVKYFKLGYYVDKDDNVSLEDISKKEEVILKKEWISANECNCNKNNKSQKGEKMDKEKLIADLIACNKNPFTEDDKPYLEGLSDERLTAFEKIMNQKPETPEKPETNAAPPANPNNINDYDLPDPVKEKLQKYEIMFQQYEQEKLAQKEAIVKAIGDSPRNKFKTDELMNMNINQLQKIAEMVNVPTNYGLNSGPAPAVQVDPLDGITVMSAPEPIYVDKKEVQH